MKEEILSIASDLREGSMTTNEAKSQLLILFGVSNSVCSCNELEQMGELPMMRCYKCGKYTVEQTDC